MQQLWQTLYVGDLKLKKLHEEKYQGADKSLARLGRRKAQKHVRDTCNFNNIETQAVIKFFSCKV